jgi:Ulp1 family protease
LTKAKKKLEKFKFFLNKLNVWRNKHGRDTFDSAEKWKLKMYSCNKQKDNYNCGIFVIFYVEQFLKTGAVNIDSSFDCLKYRHTLKQSILETCGNAQILV